MQNLTVDGQNLVNRLSQKYRLSYDAVLHMLIAVNNGSGSMAQFYCPELGGGGQWMRGGMTMVGDMFNYGLKITVDNLCNELSNALATMQIFPIVTNANYNNWYPFELGIPSSSGSQNNLRYAVFPQSRRLAVEYNGIVTIYDTLDHNISGVSQQQSGDSTLTFSSQYGTILVNSLPIISGKMIGQQQTNFANPPLGQQPTSFFKSEEVATIETTVLPNLDKKSSDEIFEIFEKLKKLYDSGLLTEIEFTSKKAELLSRL